MFLIGSEGRTVALRETLIDAAIFEGLDIKRLAVDIVSNHFEQAGNQALTHHVQVGTQRIDDAGATRFREGLQFLIVAALGQRVVHHLNETVGSQEVGNIVTDSLRIRRRRRGDGHPHIGRQFDIVVAVDTENLLDDITLPVHIDHIERSSYLGAAFTTLKEVVIQGRKDLFDDLVANLLADEMLNPGIVQVNHLLLCRNGIAVNLGTDDLSAGKFQDEAGGTTAGQGGDGRIAATLEPEGGIRLETMYLGSLADGTRIEISALDENINRSVRHARILAAEHAGNAHRFLSISDDHVSGLE